MFSIVTDHRDLLPIGVTYDLAWWRLNQSSMSHAASLRALGGARAFSCKDILEIFPYWIAK